MGIVCIGIVCLVFNGDFIPSHLKSLTMFCSASTSSSSAMAVAESCFLLQNICAPDDLFSSCLAYCTIGGVLIDV